MTVVEKHYILGIDGGGSKTESMLFSADGSVVGHGKSGPLNLAATSEKEAKENFWDAIVQATKNLAQPVLVSDIVIGLAGADTANDISDATRIFQQFLQEKNFAYQNFQLVNDIQFILAAGSANPNAIALISGTGSNCFGKNASGQTAKTSGMDYLLADEGSGYEIGRRVLRAATSSFDGRIPKSQLETLLLDHFQLSSFDQLKSKLYHPALSKSKIAQLAFLWEKAYHHHDRAAEHIFTDLIQDLSNMVSTVVNRLDLCHVQVDLVCAGSVIRLPFVFDALQKKLLSQYPLLQINVLPRSPIYGAWQIAKPRV